MAYKIGIYPEWWESIEKLSLEDKGKILENIFYYSTKGEIPHDSYIEVIFNFMKNRIDHDKNIYEKRCEFNETVGKLGGRPKKNWENSQKPEISQELIEGNPKKPNSNSNSNVSKDTHSVGKEFIKTSEDIKSLLSEDEVSKHRSLLYIILEMVNNGYSLPKKYRNLIELIDWARLVCEDFVPRGEDGCFNHKIILTWLRDWAEYYKTQPKKKGMCLSIRNSFGSYSRNARK